MPAGDDDDDPNRTVPVTEVEANGEANANNAPLDRREISGGKFTIKWPVHPGELGVSGWKKHKFWKNTIKGILEWHKISKRQAAWMIQQNCEGTAKTLLEEIDYDQLDFDEIMKMFEEHFQLEPEVEAKKYKAEFEACGRKHNEPMKEFLLRFKRAKKKYEQYAP